jgi:hypothetical protein
MFALMTAHGLARTLGQQPETWLQEWWLLSGATRDFDRAHKTPVERKDWCYETEQADKVGPEDGRVPHG